MSHRYRAKPVIVNAFVIVSVSGVHPDGSMRVMLDNMLTVTATAGMLSRFTPSPGDYWVCQQDGYEYLNPKEVFEKKYEKLEEVKIPRADGSMVVKTPYRFTEDGQRNAGESDAT